MPTNPTVRSSTLATWGLRRGDEQIAFKLDLDPADFTERLILKSYAARNLYEPGLAMLMLTVLKRGDVVFDVGANCGYFSILAGAIVGSRGHVVAIEPAPTCVARLKANLALNGFDHISVVEKVATDFEGEIMFHLNRDNSGGNALWNPGDWPSNKLSHANPNPVMMKTITLDAEWKARGFPVPKLIKVDTEGAEELVLRGARQLMADCKVPFIVAELHSFGLNKLGSSQMSLRATMAAFGYSTFLLYSSGAMPKLVPPQTEIRSKLMVDVLFSTLDRIAEYWPIEEADPFQ
jgi:FkbM family methyltransferase